MFFKAPSAILLQVCRTLSCALPAGARHGMPCAKLGIKNAETRLGMFTLLDSMPRRLRSRAVVMVNTSPGTSG